MNGYGIHVFTDIFSFHTAWVASRHPLLTYNLFSMQSRKESRLAPRNANMKNLLKFQLAQSPRDSNPAYVLNIPFARHNFNHIYEDFKCLWMGSGLL